MQKVHDNVNAIIQFREALLSDEVLYSDFVASIESALKEIPAGTGLYDVAKSIADRIIGEE